MNPLQQKTTLLICLLASTLLACTKSILEPVQDKENDDAGDTALKDELTSHENASNSADTIDCEDIICDAHAFCEMKEGTPRCFCEEGWSGDGGTCHDIDECALDQNACDVDNGRCVNSDGGYQCECTEGWALQPDATTCARTSFRYKTVATGDGFTCAVRSDDTIACFGNNAWRQSVPYNAVYEQVTAGVYHACGLTQSGTVCCWGTESSSYLDNEAPLTFIGDKQFKSITAGGMNFTCGLLNDGRAYCFGNADIEKDAPDGVAFTQIDAGYSHVCGITADGTGICWGSNIHGEAAIAFEGAASAEFKQISAGKAHSCGILTDDTVRCWGDISDKRPPEDMVFTQIVAGDTATCGITQRGDIACFGDLSFSPMAGIFERIDLGKDHLCGIDTKGNLRCEGTNTYGEAAPPEVGYTQVSIGRHEQCGLKTDGTIHCLESLQASAPTRGGFIQVAVGEEIACAIDADQSVTCWGDMTVTTPAERFLKIDIDDENGACGITTQNQIRCWGSADLAVLQDQFRHRYRDVGSGPGYICAIQTESDDVVDSEEGRPECKGENSAGQSTPMFGPFQKIAAGQIHTCGLKTDNSILCWGRMNSPSPENLAVDAKVLTFLDVSSGPDYSCGIETDGTVLCFGNCDAIQDVPHDTFVQIASADQYSCGVKKDGTLSCWGIVAR